MRLLSVLLFCLFVQFCQAQDSLSVEQDTVLRQYKKAAGANAFFLNRFLPLDNDIGINSNYLFSYRKYRPNRKFTHQGFDVDFRGTFDDDEDEPKQSTNRINIDYRIGWGRYWNIHPKVEMYGGVDWLLRGDFTHSKTTIDANFGQLDSESKLREITFGTGVGPFIGIQYNISSRFALYTEAAFYLNFDYTVDKFESGFSNSDDFTNKRFVYSRSFRLPGNLTLFYYF